MTMSAFRKIVLLLFCASPAITQAAPGGGRNAKGQPVHPDTAYTQAYSIKYGIGQLQNNGNISLQKVCSDRNGVVQVLSTQGLLRQSGGQFLFPGQLVKDFSYLPIANKKIQALGVYQNQLVYVDDKAVISNAWAGKLYSKHTLPGATLLSGANNFTFLLSDGTALQLVDSSGVLWQGVSADKLLDIQFDPLRNAFWLLGENSISLFSLQNKSIQIKFQTQGLTCFALSNDYKTITAGTHNGYYTINAATGAAMGGLTNLLPCPNLTVVKQIGGRYWFGSTDGAFMLLPNGKYKYYAGQRWLPGYQVTDIAPGSNGNVLVLTDKGLGELHFGPVTLYDKAMYYEQQVRKRHIRLGFNSTIAGLKKGDVTTGSLEDSDNDGLWTSMYLGAEVFRYAATKSPEALENCRQSLDAMERLYTITRIKGFPARSFERRGFAVSDIGTPPPGNPDVKQEYPGNASVQSPFEIWRHADDPEWDWKSTTSSDEAIGHMFVFGAIAELVDAPDLKNKAIKLMDALMQHIVEHDYYMIDWNGEPTKWGRWNPGYVNTRPENVGDRKITSSNITSMLQTAYHFTGKAIYKQKALELLHQHGFLENLMRPMKEIGFAPADADELSKNLSDGWNHSDDEMYFLGYWGLYRYALNDTLKAKFKEAILDHWEIERPEKEAAWNIFTAITGVKTFDLTEAATYLQQYPLDMVQWKVRNSQRKDIVFVPDNFRMQTITEVLPVDELPINRHNTNLFDLDGGDENGSYEYSAGDTWLLPYWMGRYLKIISAPAKGTETADKTLRIP